MSSFEKHHSKKKQIFNGGNYLLSPLNNKKINSLNYFGTNKKDNNNNQNRINIIVNKINTSQLKKKSTNVEGINNILQINKTYSLSRQKNKNKLNSNKILSTYNNINDSHLSSAKSKHKNENRFENHTTADDIKLNVSNNNNIYNLKKLYINKKIKDFNFTSKNDSFNNKNKNTVNNNFLSNRQSYEHLKTETNNNTSNDLNIKLILPNNNIFGKKSVNQNYDDIIGTPSGLFKKNNPSNFQFNSPGNILRNYYNNPNIKFSKEELIIKESFTNQSTNDSKNKKRQKSIDISISGKENSEVKKNKHKNRCPEDLHFFYINMIQKGKKMENYIQGE